MALRYAVTTLENQTPMADWWRDWAVSSPEDRYSGALMLVHAVIDLSSTDPARLMTWSEGFGGGLTMVAAPLVPGVIRCTALDPLPGNLRAMCDGAIGTDRIVLDDLNPVSFAALLTYPLLLGTGLLDQTTSPRCQYATFNRTRGSKTHLVYPGYEHERINFFENELLKFFRI